MSEQHPPVYTSTPPVYGTPIPPQGSQMPMGSPMPMGGPMGSPQHPHYVQMMSPHPSQYGTPVQYVTPSGSMIMAPQLRADPVVMDCPRCRATVQTSTESRVGGATWLWAVAGCIVTATCGIPCIGCALPFCIDGCKDVEHTCPACGYSIGTYSRL